MANHDWEWALNQTEATLKALVVLEREDPERWKKGKNFFVTIQTAMVELHRQIEEDWAISDRDMKWLEKSLKALRKWDSERF